LFGFEKASPPFFFFSGDIGVRGEVILMPSLLFFYLGRKLKFNKVCFFSPFLVVPLPFLFLLPLLVVKVRVGNS